LTASNQRSMPKDASQLAATFVRIATAETLDERLQRITDEARTVIGAHQSVVSMTRSSNWEQAITAVSLSERYSRWAGFDAPPDGSGIYRLVTESNQPMRLTQAELEAHPAWRGFGTSAAEHPPMRGWLAVPLVGRGGQNLGLIQLSDKVEGEFSEYDEALLTQFGQFAAVLMELALLQRQNDEERERFRVVANMIPQFVWSSSVAAGGNDYLNDRWYEYTGMVRTSVSDAQHRVDWREFLHPDDIEATQKAWEHSTATGEPFEVEYRFRRADGVYRWFVGRALPLRDESGHGVRWFGTCTDIEDQKQSQQEREQLLQAERVARAAAERAVRAKDDFAATLSHELRTPLNAILGWAQLLKSSVDDVDKDTLLRGLEVIERNALSQARMVDDLLDLNRLASGKLRLEWTPLNFSELLENVLDSVAPAAAAKPLTLERHLEPGIIVNGDGERLTQIVSNLLSNALKFTPAGGFVRVELGHCRDLEAVLRVQDSGKGIEPAFLPLVFERFSQADATLSRRHGGLGLGLSIVKSLVELHRGRIVASSEGKGCGAEFTVYLPLGSKADGARGSGAENGSGASLQGCRVLVVDDDPDAGDVVARILTGQGAVVRRAFSASEGLQLASADDQLIVSDIGMPGMNGYEFMRALRRRPELQRVPAVALTAMARTQDRELAFSAGFQAHLCKPVDVGQLLSVAGDLLHCGPAAP
jgi:PAS domain S-box-containing protein